MQRTNSAIGVMGLLVLSVGCGSEAEGGRSTPGVELQPPSGVNDAPKAAGDELPPPVATIELGQGSTVKFYDLKIGALVLEEGQASTSSHPVLRKLAADVNPDNTAGHLTDVFAALSPGVPVPRELVDLQDRLTNGPPVTLPRQDPPVADIPGAPNAPQVIGRAGDPGLIGSLPRDLNSASATLIGCNNGCCDPDWTRDEICYVGRNYDWDYYLFNYNWATADTGSGVEYSGSTVCSAAGTTTWTWGHSSTCGGLQYHWTVAQATFSNAYFESGTFCFGAHMWSNTNSSSSPHLHTSCGYALY